MPAAAAVSALPSRSGILDTGTLILSLRNLAAKPRWYMDLCRKPHKLTEEGARTLIQEHSDTLQRTFCGTTLAAALVNVEEKLMWAVGVGDSTVGEYPRLHANDTRPSFLSQH